MSRPDRPRPAVRLSEVLFEFQRVGNVVRVNAIDPHSGTEITMVGPSNVGQEQLKRLAKRKLEYVMSKRIRPGGRRGGTVV